MHGTESLNNGDTTVPEAMRLLMSMGSVVSLERLLGGKVRLALAACVNLNENINI